MELKNPIVNELYQKYSSKKYASLEFLMSEMSNDIALRKIMEIGDLQYRMGAIRVDLKETKDQKSQEVLGISRFNGSHSLCRRKGLKPIISHNRDYKEILEQIKDKKKIGRDYQKSVLEYLQKFDSI